MQKFVCYFFNVFPLNGMDYFLSQNKDFLFYAFIYFSFNCSTISKILLHFYIIKDPQHKKASAFCLKATVSKRFGSLIVDQIFTIVSQRSAAEQIHFKGHNWPAAHTLDTPDII